MRKILSFVCVALLVAGLCGCYDPEGVRFPSGVENVNRGLSRVRTRAFLNRHEAHLYGEGDAFYNAVQAEFPFYAFFVAVHSVEGDFKGRCNL